MTVQDDMSATMMNRGPPYRPTVWSLGGTPTFEFDIPITVVFLLLYIVGAVLHMSRFILNNKRGHKFIFSALLFVFCMSRILTTMLRIASIANPTNFHFTIITQILVPAGVVLLFVTNLLWTQRIVRALHPLFGWHPASIIALKVLCVLIVFTVIITISATVQSFYSVQLWTKTIDRGLQIYGAFFQAIISFLPIPIVLLAFIFGTHWESSHWGSGTLEDGFVVHIALPRKSTPEKFGHGRLRTKALILLTSSTLLSLGASYRCGTLWLKPVPRSQPLPPYFHPACFYIFNFVVEIVVVYLYAFMRVDLQFHVPDGSHGTYKSPIECMMATRSDVEMRGRAEKYGNDEIAEMDPPTPTTPLLTLTALPAFPPVIAKVPTWKGSQVSERGSLRPPKRVWRKSEESRIIQRLGGPWERLGG